MAKSAGKWIESRRCVVCNELKWDNHKKKHTTDPDKKAGFIPDPHNPDKWVPCTCNNKGFNTRKGTLSA